MKIYTRTGDTGTTGLFGAGRVSKNHPRIEAYGTVDETNATLGIVRALMKGEPGEEQLHPLLTQLQNELFVLGSDLATPLNARVKIPRITSAHVVTLEQTIDIFEGPLPPLKTFIMPGGTAAAAMLHLARTVCRRAERRTLSAHVTEELNPQAAIYLNRLSDLLFILARWVNNEAKTDEIPWIPSKHL